MTVIKVIGAAFTANQTSNVVPLPAGQGNATTGASCLYIYAPANATVTVANAGGNVGAFVVPGGQYIILQKNSTDTIQINPNTAVVPIVKTPE